MGCNNGYKKDPYIIRERLRRSADEYGGSSTSRGIRGAVVGTLNDLCGGDDNRRALLGFVFGIGGPMSAKHINDAEILALYEWIGYYSEDGVWKVSCDFENEIAILMKEVEYANRDEEMVPDDGQDFLPGS